MQAYSNPLVNPYAPPGGRALSLPPAGATAFDENDLAILLEAQQSQLWFEGRDEWSRAQQGQTGRAAWALISGRHALELCRSYRVRATDGLAWTYLQPYSATRQLPGEHTFTLRGALPSPLQVLPPAVEWRQPRFWMGLIGGSFLLLFLYGLGLLVPPLLILLYRPWAKLKSPDARLARWVSSHSHVMRVIKNTKFGWLGVLGAGGWEMPWVIQLHSLGDGTSRLVVKAPDIGRHNLLRYRVGFLQAAAIARAFQSILPPGSGAPPQDPLQSTLS